MEIVVNRRYGGFGLSVAAIKRYAELAGITLYPHLHEYDTPDAQSITWEHAEEVGMGLTDLCFATEECINADELDDHYWYHRDIGRDDPHLVAVVRELGSDADGSHAKLNITEVPDDVEWKIEEYDGKEWVAETHRTW